MPLPKIIFITLSVLTVIVVGRNFILSTNPAIPIANQTEPAPQLGYKNITSLELNSMLASKDFYLVNVHIPYEGEFEKTDAKIAFDEIGQNLDKLPQDKNSKIVLYCQTGRMSQIAAQTLTALGYTNVYNQLGGMIDWDNQGFEVLTR